MSAATQASALGYVQRPYGLGQYGTGLYTYVQPVATGHAWGDSTLTEVRDAEPVLVAAAEEEDNANRWRQRSGGAT